MTPGVRSSPRSRYRKFRGVGYSRGMSLGHALRFTRLQVIYFALRGWGVMYRMDVTSPGVTLQPSSEHPVLVIECTFRSKDEPVQRFYPRFYGKLDDDDGDTG